MQQLTEPENTLNKLSPCSLGPESGLARYLEYTDGHRDPGHGDKVALHPLLARAQATAVIDHEARVPSLGYSFFYPDICYWPCRGPNKIYMYSSSFL